MQLYISFYLYNFLTLLKIGIKTNLVGTFYVIVHKLLPKMLEKNVVKENEKQKPRSREDEKKMYRNR